MQEPEWNFEAELTVSQFPISDFDFLLRHSSSGGSFSALGFCSGSIGGRLAL
jgi:hypothetical protein